MIVLKVFLTAMIVMLTLLMFADDLLIVPCLYRDRYHIGDG